MGVLLILDVHVSGFSESIHHPSDLKRSNSTFLADWPKPTAQKQRQFGEFYGDLIDVSPFTAVLRIAEPLGLTNQIRGFVPFRIQVTTVTVNNECPCK